MTSSKEYMKEWRRKNQEHIRNYGKLYKNKLKIKYNKKCVVCEKLLDYRTKLEYCYKHRCRKHTKKEKIHHGIKMRDWYVKNKNTDKYNQTKIKIGKANKRALTGRKLSDEHRKNVVRALRINSLNPKRIKNLPRGKTHHFWKGGITSLNEKLRKQSKWKIWREAVFLRDNFICQNPNCNFCQNKIGVMLHPHHVKPVSLYPNLIFDINNGITYCEEFHLKSGLHKGIMEVIK